MVAPTARRRIAGLGWAAAIVACGVLYSPQRLLAAGAERILRGADLMVTIDSRWAGSAYGGNYPVRIRAVNKGPTRNFRFAVSPLMPRELPTIERTVTVEQNATVQFTLSIPLVGDGTAGEFRVFEGGQEVPPLRTNLSFPSRGSAPVQPAMLAVSKENLDFKPFEAAVNTMLITAANTSTSMPGMRGAYGYGGYNSESYQQVDPSLLPESWVHYSGLDIVSIPLPVLAALPTAEREAILQWTHCGGTLVVGNVGAPAGSSTQLASILGIEAGEWTAADPNLHISLPSIPNEDGTVGPQVESHKWSDGADAFASRELMLGRVFAFERDPFVGSVRDWKWWLKSADANRWQWTTRMGCSSRQPSNDFWSFRIPGVGGVPVSAFLILITLFTIAIGPLNYFLLWRRRKLYLLVVTIPALAFVTTITLFGYAMVADGFGVKSRCQSVTLLDQRTKSAVSLSRTALYAGMAPSAGLNFSPDTAVLPIWAPGEGFEYGSIDWTANTQHLSAGWFHSRTLTQFLTIQHRGERGRIDLPVRGTGEKMPASNGLEWDVAVLVAVDADGRTWLGRSLPAGASTELAHVEPNEAQRALTEALADHESAVLAAEARNVNNLSTGETAPVSYSGMYGGYRNDLVNAQFSTGDLQRRIGELRTNRVDHLTSRPRSYIAILEQNPGIEMGLKRTTERAGFHVLFGTY
ncbi:MAG TPA: hypothetical protein VHB77_01390 [Planctomycetaceae bacterium]|nr:hypothetical protein [Planctomycetaceae bacterium]